MTIEEKLKKLIEDRYKSLHEFTTYADIPHSTMVSILKRGVENSSIKNIIKICNVLHLSVDALANGEIVPKFSKKDEPQEQEVKDIINETKLKMQNNVLTINGKKVDIEVVEPIIEAIEIGYKMTENKVKKENI